MTKLRIKTGDEVVVTAGKDKGKRGKVVQTFPKLGHVVVEGVRVTKRHLRSRSQEEAGQVVEFPMPINASNVMPIGASGKPVRHRKARKEDK